MRCTPQHSVGHALIQNEPVRLFAVGKCNSAAYYALTQFSSRTTVVNQSTCIHGGGERGQKGAKRPQGVTKHEAVYWKF